MACWDSIYKNTVASPIYRQTRFPSSGERIAHRPECSKRQKPAPHVARLYVDPGVRFLEDWGRGTYQNVVGMGGRGISRGPRIAGQMLGLHLDLGKMGLWNWVQLGTIAHVKVDGHFLGLLEAGQWAEAVSLSPVWSQVGSGHLETLLGYLRRAV